MCYIYIYNLYYIYIYIRYIHIYICYIYVNMYVSYIIPPFLTLTSCTRRIQPRKKSLNSSIPGVECSAVVHGYIIPN